MCHHSLVQSSVPSILPPRVRIVYLSLELECDKNENKQKDAGLAHFYKMSILQLYLRRVVINNRKALQIGHREV